MDAWTRWPRLMSDGIRWNQQECKRGVVSMNLICVSKQALMAKQGKTPKDCVGTLPFANTRTVLSTATRARIIIKFTLAHRTAFARRDLPAIASALWGAYSLPILTQLSQRGASCEVLKCLACHRTLNTRKMLAATPRRSSK